MNRLVTALAGVALLSLVQPAKAADIFNSNGGMKDGPDRSYDEGRSGRNWNSVYVGVGLDWLHNNYELSAPGFNFDGISGDGAEANLIAGVQRQFGQIVIGAEGRVGWSEASTDLTFGPFEATLESDFSYAGYAKLGFAFANNQALLSALGGYKCQHFQANSNIPGDTGSDDTFCGLSGGVLLEAKLTEQWVLGADVIYTKLEDVSFGGDEERGGITVDPSQWAAGLRLTYGF